MDSTEKIQNGPNETEEKLSWKSKALEVTRAFVAPIAIVLLFRFYIIQPFIVKGASMEPTFEDREYLIIDEITPVLKPLARGAVIVFRYPARPSDFFIKRIIGLPGERIIIKNGQVKIINPAKEETILKESYLARGIATVGEIDLNIPAKAYFVMGDNRNYSSDSRHWGILSKDFITGRALIRLWPPDRAGFIENANY